MRAPLSWFLTLVLGGTTLAGLAQTPPAPAPVGGLGDLLVAPGRMVFEGRKRSGELNLSNIGTTKATYRISLVLMEMDEKGGFKEAPASPELASLQAMFRFSPREVVLEPQESQAVRIQIRKPADLATGEYRLHMVFRGVPATPEPYTVPPPSAKGLSISLTPIYGLAIPLIIRNGETAAKVAITEPKFGDDRRSLQFRLDRTGNQSVYGDIEATLLPASGPPKVLVKAVGLAVYTPNPTRLVTLTLPPDVPLPPGGRIRITYSLPVQDGAAKLAETFLPLAE
jgi:P pilus assembly chaperone PapD